MNNNTHRDVEFSLDFIEKWPEPMLLMDGERFIEANPAAVRLLGYPDKSSLLQRSPVQISPPVQPDGQPSLLKARDLLDRVQKGESLRFEWVHLSARDTAIYVEVMLTHVVHAGRHIVLCAWHDIGELKHMQAALAESESRFRGFFEKNASIMVLLDPIRNCVVDANESAARFYGYPREQLVGMPVSYVSLMSPEDRESVRRQVLNEGQAHIYTEHRLANGEVRNIELYVTVFATNGNPLLFAVIHDITERRRAETALRLANEALARSNLDLKHFAHVVAHDLQTPLRTISIFTELLHKEASTQLSEQAGQWASMVVDAARRMQALIDDLLTYSRLDSPSRPMEPIDCQQLLGEVKCNLATRIKETGAEIIGIDLPQILADRTQLAQVFQNLIENGIKYNSSRMPRVTVTARREADAWLFCVSDNGIGIAPKYHHCVFDIFRRLHTHQEYPGTGLGLAICHRVIERHGGRIWVESEGGKGSRFLFTLSAPD